MTLSSPVWKGLLVAVPLALLFLVGTWMGDRIHFSQVRADATTIREDLRRTLEHMIRQADPRLACEDVLRRATRSLAWGNDPASILTRLPRGSQVFAFDGRGRRVTRPWATTGMKSASERVLANLRQVARRRRHELSRADSQVTAGLLGNLEALYLLPPQAGRLVDLTFLGVTRLAGVFPYRARAGGCGFLLAVIDRRSLNLGTVVERAVTRLGSLTGARFAWGLLDLVHDRAVGISTPRRLPAAWCRRLASRLPTREFRRNRSFWASTLLQGRFLVAGRADLPLWSPPSQRFRWPLFLLWMVLVWLAWLARPTLTFPLRWQVVILFGLAGTGTIAMLLGMARVYLDERERVLIRARQTQAQSWLEKVDRRFLDDRARRAESYRTILVGCTDETILRERAPRRLERFRASPGAVAVFLLDRRGRIIHRQEPTFRYSLREYWGAQVTPVLERIGLQAPKDFNGEPQDPVPTEDLLLKLAQGMAGEFVRFAGEIRNFDLGKGQVPVFFDLAKDSAGRAFASLLVTHERNALERDSFRHLVRRATAPQGGLFLALLRPDRRRDLVCFREFAEEADLHYTAGLVQRVNAPQFQEGRFRGHPVLIVGVPGKHLRDYLLFQIIPLEPIRQAGQRLWWRFFALAGVTFLFAIGLGFLVSDLLLTPVGALTDGVRHLREGRFSETPNLKTGDLLQEIGTGIGLVMEEMAELARARTVQQQLFPERPLMVGEGRCRGWMQGTAEIPDLGYDFFPLGDGAIAFWLAGVPGRFLNAALGLAMTKMALRLAWEDDRGSPGTMLKQVQASVLARFRGLEGATILLGVFVPATGEIRVAWSGTFSILFPVESHGPDGMEGAPSPPLDREWQGLIGPGQNLLLTNQPPEEETVSLPGERPRRYRIRPLPGESSEAASRSPSTGRVFLQLERSRS